MSAIITENTQVSYRARWKIPLGHSSDGDAEQIVGRERRERVSQLTRCGEGCCDSRRRVNSDVRPLRQRSVKVVTHDCLNANVGELMSGSDTTRPLTEMEHQLASWMLEHGVPEALAFLHQLEEAEVSSWRCPCGCASINFLIKGQPKPRAGIRVLGDFVFGEGERESGAFIFESDGVLGGIEVYGFGDDAPKILPAITELRVWGPGTQPN